MAKLSNEDNKLRNTFLSKFPALILENEIVASILFVTVEKIARMKKDIDKTLNNDI